MNRATDARCFLFFSGALLLAMAVLPVPAVAQQEEEPPERAGSREEELAPPELGDIDDLLAEEDQIFGSTADGYTYDPAGRRDPFKSLLATSESPEIRGPRPEGIPGLLIDEVNLIGIVEMSSGYIAQVQAADKQKSYLLREGDQLFDGEVVSISRGEVVFKQVVQDPTALKPFRERVKTLNP